MTSTTQSNQAGSKPGQRQNRPHRLRASNPAELVALVPYLFGFVPSNSAIVIAFEGKTINVLARMDAEVITSMTTQELSSQLAPVMAQGLSHVVIGWHDDAEQGERLAEAVKAALGPCQVIVTSADRCKTAGGPWVEVANTVPTAEQAGLTVLPTRQHLDDQLAGPGRQRMAEAKRCWASTLVSVKSQTLPWRSRRAMSLLRAGLADVESLPVGDKVELAALMWEGTVRDGIWETMTRQKADAQVTLWSAVVAAVPKVGAVVPLGLVAVAAWLNG